MSGAFSCFSKNPKHAGIFLVLRHCLLEKRNLIIDFEIRFNYKWKITKLIA